MERMQFVPAHKTIPAAKKALLALKRKGKKLLKKTLIPEGPSSV
jgi:hypothetical protein